jgi:hypothetical protein
MDLLTILGLKHNTDKVSHDFCAFYHRHLDRVRQDVRKVLEIGILKGASLRMWREYFPNATIHGFDQNAIHGFDYKALAESLPDGIFLHEGDQANRDSLGRLLEATGSDFDLIVDDGGHAMAQQQVSLGVLFPHLRPGGMYIVEDLHTSFMSSINYYADGRLIHSAPTGVLGCLCTTYDLIRALADGRSLKSSYLTASELEALAAGVEGVEIFDRDGDLAHITSLIRKRPAAGGTP